MIIKYKSKKISIDAKKVSIFGAIKGLMFTRKENARALLLFDLKKPSRLKIHSFFCCKFLAVWLNKENSVAEIKIVKPWNPLIFPKKPFYKLVEIPFNNKYNRIIQILVGGGKV